MSNPVVHFEVGSPDTAQAAQFYSSLFGWTGTPMGPATMIDIINASTGRSFTSELVFAPEVLTGRYGTGFALGLMAKDVRIAQNVAAAAATDAPVLALTDERWSKALSEFGPAADQSMAHRAWWGDRPDGD